MSDKKQSDADFFKLWGITPETASGPQETRSLDINDFNKQWGLSGAPASSAVPAAKRFPRAGHTSQIVQGMPIIGPMMDRAVAATDAALDPLFGKNKDKSFGDRYSINLDEVRQENKLYAEQNPITSTAANIVGGTLATVPLGMTALGARALGMVGTWGSRIYQGAIGGATIGGADAALRGENVASGAGVGGAVGVAAPIVGHGVERGVSGAANYLFPRPGPLRGTNSVARNWLLDAMDGETPASIAAARGRMGPAGVVADINPALTDLAGGVADIPGPGKTVVRETLRRRQAGQRDRIEEAISEALGPRINLANLTRVEKAARKEAADPLYEAWRATSVTPTPQLKSLGTQLEDEGFFKEANRLLAADGKETYKSFFTPGERKNWPTAEAWDYVKQSIDGKIRQAQRAGEDNSVRVYTNLKNRLVNAIDSHPDPQVAGVWQEAREAWANPTAIMRARESGRDVWKRSVRGDELGYELTDLTSPERMAFVQGARDELSQMMDASTRGDTTVRNMLLAPANQEKLTWLATRRGYNANRLSGRLEQEITNAATYRNIVGGSQTTPKAQRVNALMPPPLPGYLDTFEATKPATWIPNALRPQTIFEGARAERYGNATRQIAPILMTRQGPQMDDLVAALVAERNRQAIARATAGRFGNALTGAIAGPGQSVGQNRFVQTMDGTYAPAP